MTMASPSELSLDCKPHSYSMLLKSFGDTNTASHHLHPPFEGHRLEEHLSRLEEERLKIDAFKRELPLCMQLLSNAVEASRQQLKSYRATSGTQGIKRPILEEFIPMKHSSSEGPLDQLKPPNTTSDKANWMTTAQLWSQTDVGAKTKQLESLPSQDLEMGLSPKLALLDENNNNKQQGHGRAFLPFIKERNGIGAPLPNLALASDEREMEEKKGSLMSEGELRSDNGTMMISKAMDNTNQTNGDGSTTTTTTSNTTQTQRKQRRCWSPDLHRRFVNALQMLGGSQVATPKQIRELMKVDGLTNDEVKSHLQKYRLHTRRPGPSPQGSGAHGPQLVVLGGIWVPPEYATAAAHHHGVPQQTMYSCQATAQVGPHYCPPGFPHEFYPSPLSQVAQPQAHHPHQVHFYKASSQGKSSLDRSESIEDGKSESSSGGEESSEKKRLASKREGEEESNGSEIILKF